MSFEKDPRLQALAQLEIAQATSLEFFDMASKERDRNKIKARIFFNSSIKEIREGWIVLNLSDDIEALEKLLVTRISDLEKEKPYFEDFKKLLVNVFKDKTIKFSIKELVFAIRESISLATRESKEELRFCLRQFLHAIKELPWHLEWVNEWKYELERAYIDCLAEDRERYDEIIAQTLEASIKFRANTNKAFNVFYDMQNKRIKDSFERKYRNFSGADTFPGESDEEI